MNKTMFDELLASVEEMDKIARGDLKPDRRKQAHLGKLGTRAPSSHGAGARAAAHRGCRPAKPYSRLAWLFWCTVSLKSSISYDAAGNLTTDAYLVLPTTTSYNNMNRRPVRSSWVAACMTERPFASVRSRRSNFTKTAGIEKQTRLTEWAIQCCFR